MGHPYVKIGYNERYALVDHQQQGALYVKAHHERSLAAEKRRHDSADFGTGRSIILGKGDEISATRLP
ncbi:hypothetical protein ED328_16845 [Muribaculaceae bacterium Isolate-001 (NCI)]|nr:hypothetical protein ED328_16845 [Muribaculaceae bacterium Isolate-001 (NCI)]